MEKERDNSGEQFPRDRDDNFRTPEDQILHFLARAGRPGWKWMSVSKTKQKTIIKFLKNFLI